MHTKHSIGRFDLRRVFRSCSVMPAVRPSGPFMTDQVPGFPEISEWPVTPSMPLRIGNFGIYRDPGPHCTMYVDLVDSDETVFNFFFDRFLGRLCFGCIDDAQDAAFLKKGSRIQTEVFAIMDELCGGRDEYKDIQSRLELARNYV